HERRRHQYELMLHMIECRDGMIEAPDSIRESQIVLRLIRQMLDEPHGIVAQVSHRPARKPRKATYADLRVPIELSLNGLENVTPNRSPAFSILDLHIHAPRAKDFIRILTEERISSQLHRPRHSPAKSCACFPCEVSEKPTQASAGQHQAVGIRALQAV